MEEEFYALIKLVSGEELICSVYTDESEDEVILILQNPVLMSLTTRSAGTILKIEPWMKMSGEDLFFLKLDKVITMTELDSDNQYLDYYIEYLETGNVGSNPGSEVKMTRKMGYLTSVEQARQTLENCFNIKQGDIKDS